MLPLLLATLASRGQLPPIAHATLTLPPGATMKAGCATRNLGVTVRGVHYFAPTVGSPPNIVTFTPATQAWGAVPITGVGAAVVKSLAGCTMSGVEAPPGSAGLDDFLVFGGGAGSNAVTQYNIRTKAWSSQKPLSHVTSNLCSSGCMGYAFFATGDFKKTAALVDDDDAAMPSASFKPSDRQIQRYNLTNGQMEENNMEKTRAGAVCACYSPANGATSNFTVRPDA